MPKTTTTRLGVLTALAVLLSCGKPLPTDYTTSLTTTTIEPVAFDAVYVVNSEAATISVVNAETNAVSGTIGITGVTYPYRVSFSPDNTLLAVAIPGYDMSGGEYGHEHHSGRRGQILLLDARTGALKGSRTTDAATNNAVFAPRGELWTSQATVPGSTLVLDAQSLETRDAISVGTSPTATQLAGDGRVAFVANAGSASVSVIDVESRRVRSTVRVGAGPVAALPSPDGLVYVQNEPDRSISVIDASTLAVARTFDLGYRPGSIAVPAAGELWVTSPDRGLVEIRDATGVPSRTIATGAGARGMVFSADGKRAYVSNESEDTVSVVDRASFAATAKIPVGAKPNGMAWRSR